MEAMSNCKYCKRPLEEALWMTEQPCNCTSHLDCMADTWLNTAEWGLVNVRDGFEPCCRHCMEPSAEIFDLEEHLNKKKRKVKPQLFDERDGMEVLRGDSKEVEVTKAWVEVFQRLAARRDAEVLRYYERLESEVLEDTTSLRTEELERMCPCCSNHLELRPEDIKKDYLWSSFTSSYAFESNLMELSHLAFSWLLEK